MDKLNASKELMFYLLKENGLTAEVLDFAGVGNNSDIAHYYVSESILGMQLKPGQTYTNALASVEHGSAACQITQKTKALFLDQGVDVATQFLSEELHELRTT